MPSVPHHGARSSVHDRSKGKRGSVVHEKQDSHIRLAPQEVKKEKINFDRIDVAKTGVITEDDFVTYQRKNAGQKFTEDKSRQQFKKADTNHKGFITFAEYLEAKRLAKAAKTKKGEGGDDVAEDEMLAPEHSKPAVQHPAMIDFGERSTTHIATLVNKDEYGTLAEGDCWSLAQPVEALDTAERVNITRQEVMPEPDRGLEPSDFSASSVNKYLDQLLVQPFEPTRFAPSWREAEKIPDAEKLTRAVDVIAMKNKEQTHAIFLNGTHQSLEALKKTIKAVSAFKYLETLKLNNLNIRDLSQLNVPSTVDANGRPTGGLLYCHLQFNLIDNVKQVIKFAQRHPTLKVLDIRENPVVLTSSWHDSLPLCSPSGESMKEGWKIVAQLTAIEFFNGHKITMRRRQQAIFKYGEKDMQGRVATMMFDSAMNESKVVQDMTTWTPETITNLSLCGCNLVTVNVSDFTNLRDLDLAANRLEDLRTTGVHKCVQLESLNLEKNDLKKNAAANLRFIGFLRPLLHLHLRENHLPSSYRMQTIFETRNLKGTNRSPGLVTLDGIAISVQERIAAWKQMGKQSKGELEGRVWSYFMIANMGHAQFKSDLYVSKLSKLVIQNAGLTTTNLQAMTNLQWLDLSGNPISHIDGLGRQPLMVLLLHGTHVNKNDIFKKLKEAQVRTLVEISLSADIKKEDKKLRKKMLESLFFVESSNKRLAVLDKKAISIDEYVTAYKAAEGKAVDENTKEGYRYNLAVTISATPPLNRQYHPKNVGVGGKGQYDAANITELLRLESQGLAQINVGPFKNLVRLNVANNLLTTISMLGLDSCKCLKELDIHNNKIETPVKEIGNYLNSVPSLQLLSIRDNGCMGNNKKKKEQARDHLISSILRMREPECDFRIIDTEVTLDERVEAWKKGGGKTEEMQTMRYKAALHLRVPPEMKNKKDQIKALNLNGMHMPKLDIKEFTNLEILLLRDNEFARMSDVIGLEDCSQLKVLDMRNNRLEKLDEATALVSGTLSNLIYIGLCDNVFSTKKKLKQYTETFIAGVPRLFTDGCCLRYMDMGEISMVDILKYNAQAKAEPLAKQEQFKFDTLINRVIPDEIKRCGVENETQLQSLALNAKDYQLHFVNMARFTGLVSLNLSGNALHDCNGSNLDKLQQLELLDITRNQFTAMDQIAKVLNNLPQLSVVYLDQNPCFDHNDNKRRVGLLSLLTRTSKAGMKLRFLNNDHAINPTERYDACKIIAHNTPDILSTEGAMCVKTGLTLEYMGITESDIEIDLQKRHLSSIGGLPTQCLLLCECLLNLDLSHNELTSLVWAEEVTVLGEHEDGHCGLGRMVSLRTLDISHNKIADFDASVQALSHCNELTTLMCDRAFVGKPTLSDKELMVLRKQLRGCTHIGEKINPKKLSNKEMSHVQWLKKVSNNKHGPNSMINVDLSGVEGVYNKYKGTARAISQKELSFQKALSHLRNLPVETLVASYSKWEKERNYRFWLIDEIATLKVLDGLDVTDDDRTNAQEQVDLQRKEEEKGGAVKKKRKDASDDPEAEDEDDVEDADAALRHQQPIHEHTGSVMTKSEILINFIQIYTITMMSFYLPIELHVDFYDFTKYFSYFTVFSLEIDMVMPSFILIMPMYRYMKFAIMMVIPTLLSLFYGFDMSSDSGRKELYLYVFVDNWKTGKNYRFLAVSMWFLIFSASYVYGAVTDFDANFILLMQGSMPFSVVTRTILGVTFGISSFMLFVFFMLARSLRKAWFRCEKITAGTATASRDHKREFDKWWRSVNYTKTRLILFLFTMLYMPIISSVLINFKCLYSEEPPFAPLHLEAFPEMKCVESLEGGVFDAGSLSGFHDIHYLAVFFFFVWGIGIPIFFYRLVKYQSHHLDLGFHIEGSKDNKKWKEDEERRIRKELYKLGEEIGKLGKGVTLVALFGEEAETVQRAEGVPDQEKVKVLHAALKEIPKKIKERKKRQCEEYVHAVHEFKAPEAYLFQAYDRPARYTKIFNMIEKVMLVSVGMIVPAFMSIEKGYLGEAVLLLFLMYSAYMSPFSDAWEDRMDLICRITNCFNLTIVILARQEVVSTANALWGLYGVNSLNFIQIGFNFISSPFRKCMADFRHTSKVKKMIRERELAQKKLDHHHDSHAQGKAQRFQASRASTDVGALAEK